MNIVEFQSWLKEERERNNNESEHALLDHVIWKAKSLEQNAHWYNRGIEIGVYAVFACVVMVAIASGIMFLGWLGKVLFGGG